MPDIAEILRERHATPAALPALFDALAPVAVEEMQGRWKGFEITTGHPMDGLLEASGWYGKLFASAEEVHPLLMHNQDRTEVFAMDPGRLPLSLAGWVPRAARLSRVVAASRLLLRTREPRARLRMVEYRGRPTATMIYDQIPVMDHFARVDANTMLGLMDMRGMPHPYAFVLERDEGGPRLDL
ncbi:DUF4334 domain-containing protein [Roseococcus microcysteis]|uniref:DUF4334 domain-containing protein n=1 Tax=Roseococcus microcysteis TaxID=2771361 RepID=UPI00168B1557|nr:DUF4334 domain-containing protein [Roseococcus microcysteis]